MARVNAWREPHPVWIVGHRGAPIRARENTIASLDWAETLGADAVEFDLRQTRDGEAVLFHDEEIALGAQRVPVRGFTSREIERLTLASSLGEYRIPRLEEVFHRYGRVLKYVVEVKTSRDTQLSVMARRVSRVAAEYSVTDRCLVVSFDADFLRRVRDADPELATGFLFDHPVALPEPGRPTPLFPPVDAVGPRKDLLTPHLLEQTRAAGLSIHVWTADEPDEIERLIRAGVASVTTNVPDVGIQVRQSLNIRAEAG